MEKILIECQPSPAGYAFYLSENISGEYVRAEVAEKLLAAAKELLRVDDAWYGSINSEMATARNKMRQAIASADAENNFNRVQAGRDQPGTA